MLAPPPSHAPDDPIAAWLDAARRDPGIADTGYPDALVDALAAAPDWSEDWAPLIAAQFARPPVLAAEFRRHAVTEGIGTATIAHVAGRCADPALAAAMAAHADDEARHCRMFDALARHLAPVNDGRFAALHADNDAFLEGFGGDVAWFLVDTHVAELRNLVLLGLYVRAAEAAGADLHVRRSLERIFADEWRHVGYTAPHVAALVARGSAERAEFVATVAGYAHDAAADADRLRHDLLEPIDA